MFSTVEGRILLEAVNNTQNAFNEVKGDIKDMEEKAKKSERELSASVERAGEAGEAVGTGIGKAIAAGIAAATTAITTGILLVRKWEDELRGAARTETIIKNVGLSSIISMERLEKFGETMERQWGIAGGSVVRAAGHLAETLPESQEQMEEYLRVAANFGAKTGQGTESAADFMARAARSASATISLLAKEGIQLEEFEKNMLQGMETTRRYGDIMAFMVARLGKQTDGMALAMFKSSRETTRFGLALDQVGDMLGKILKPTYDEFMKPLNDELETFAEGLAKIAEDGGGAVEIINLIAERAGVAKEAISKIPVGAMLDALAVGTNDDAKKKIEEREKMLDEWFGFGEKAEARKRIVRGAMRLNDMFGGDTVEGIRKINEAIRELDKDWGIASKAELTKNKMAEWVGVINNTVVPSVNNFEKDAIAVLGKAWDAFIEDINEAEEETKGFASAMDTYVTGASNTAGGAIDSFAAKLRGLLGLYTEEEKTARGQRGLLPSNVAQQMRMVAEYKNEAAKARRDLMSYDEAEGERGRRGLVPPLDVIVERRNRRAEEEEREADEQRARDIRDRQRERMVREKEEPMPELMRDIYDFFKRQEGAPEPFTGPAKPEPAKPAPAPTPVPTPEPLPDELRGTWGAEGLPGGGAGRDRLEDASASMKQVYDALRQWIGRPEPFTGPLASALNDLNETLQGTDSGESLAGSRGEDRLLSPRSEIKLLRDQTSEASTQLGRFHDILYEFNQEFGFIAGKLKEKRLGIDYGGGPGGSNDAGGTDDYVDGYGGESRTSGRPRSAPGAGFSSPSGGAGYTPPPDENMPDEDTGGVEGAVGLNERERRAFEWAKSKNMSPEQIAAFMARVKQESNFNPKAHNTVGEDSLGVMQANKAYGRQDLHFRKYGAKYGDDISQYEAWWKESFNEEKSSGDAFRRARTLEEANEAMLRNIRPKTWIDSGKRGRDWEDQDEDSQAYLRKFQVRPPAMAGGAGADDLGGVSRADALVLEQQAKLAKIRKGELADQTREWLEAASKATGLGVRVKSGGQPRHGREGVDRTGTHRHDEGGAADIDLFERETGRILSMARKEDRAQMSRFVTEAVKAGATGVGAGEGYMGKRTIHVGGGKPASWGGAGWIERARIRGIQERQQAEQVAKQEEERNRLEASLARQQQQEANREKLERSLIRQRDEQKRDQQQTVQLGRGEVKVTLRTPENLQALKPQVKHAANMDVSLSVDNTGSSFLSRPGDPAYGGGPR